MRIIALFEFNNEQKSHAKKYSYDSKFNIDIEQNDNDSILFDIRENKVHVENFYGDNVDALSFIVGKNSSGKTTLLRKLISFVHNDFEEYSKFAFFVLRDNKIVLYSDIEVEVTGVDSDGKILGKYNFEIVKVNPKGSEKERNEQPNTDTVLISNSIEKNYQAKFGNYAGFHDMTLMKKLYEQRFEFIESEISSNQLIFAMDDLKKTKKESVLNAFRVKSSITIESNYRDTYSDYFSKQNNYFDELDKLTKELLEEKATDSEILYQLNRKFLLSEIEARASRQLDEDNIEKNDEDNVEKKDKDMALINYITGYMEIEKIKNDVSFEVSLGKYSKFIENLRIKELSKKEKEKQVLPIEINAFKDTDLEYLGMNIFEELNPKWQGMSSGANCLLSIFGNLSSIEFKQNEMIIFLDEVDIGLHPEWQRKFLSVFLRSLKDILPQKRIQLILTTHSPIILSDVRQLDVNYVGGNDDVLIKTFGANINDLISESFFAGSGMMGKFSESVIKSLIDHLYISENTIDKKNEDQKIELKAELIKDDPKVEALIEEIGEVVLRTQLKEMYLGYLKQRNRIESLERELKRLKEGMKEYDQLGNA